MGFVNMNAFVSIIFLAVSSLAAPAADPQLVVAAKPYFNQGSASGPLTPAVGDLVATPNGYRSLALEGFSEDLNQDGFVDPIGQAVPVVQTVAVPAVAAAPVATYAALPAIKTVAVPAVKTVAAPAVKTVAVPAATVPVAVPAVKTVAVPAATVPVAHHVGYAVQHQVHHVPQVSVQRHVTHHTTQHIINHAPVVGAWTAGVVPALQTVAVQAAPAAAEETAPAVETA